MASIPASSTEYLHIPVEGGSGSIPGEIAVISGCNEPTELDWRPATWDTNAYKALVGPDASFPLAAGVYTAWVRLDAPPEQVVRRSGIIRVGP